MYVDSKPTATFQETSGWKMPSPHPMGPMKRPPIVRNGSSSSALSGMEQAIPPFQDFVKQTAPVLQKALPPAPYIPRRASSTSPPPRSRSPSPYITRRSSSVYSRTASQWGSDISSWKSADFADEPLPPLPMLQPMAYSVSTPHLGEQLPTPPLLQARAYSPLIISPSPTASRVSTPSPPPQHKPSILLPEPPVSAQVPKKHLRTVSLEKARADVHSPGAVHLLPEELRAQHSIAKSKSHEAMRMDSVSVKFGENGPHVPHADVLIDRQGRRRTLQSPTEQSGTEYPFPTVPSEARDREPTSKIGSKYEKNAPPLCLRQTKASRDKVAQALGVDDMDEPRGRTRQRGPRNMYYSHYLPNNKTDADVYHVEQQTNDAGKIAQEYHSLLTEQHRSPTSSPAYYRTDSDDSIKNHMKLVPRPLFQTKPPAKLPGTVINRPSEPYTSPYRLSDGDAVLDNASVDSSGSSTGPNPFDRDSNHKRRSTSGSIPISPPSETSPISLTLTRETTPRKSRKAVKVRRDSPDNRVSAFYPYIAPRKRNRAHNVTSRAGAQTPPLPLLPKDIVAERLKTPESSIDSMSLRDNRPASKNRKDKYRRGSNASSDGGRLPLHERIARGAAKYADLLTKPTELPERRKYRTPVRAATINSVRTATAAPDSPHLMPSLVKSPPPRVRLGWSDSSKHAHDSSRSLISSPRPLNGDSESPRKPQFTHIQTPARPLDERADGLREMEAPKRKNSIFGGMLDGWKESKADRRREDLKKAIKVVPNENGTTPPMKRRSSAFGWM